MKRKFLSDFLTFTVFAVIFGFALNACAQADLISTTTAKFLKIPIGGRPTGMGGAYAGAAEGVESMFWNPAGLSRTERSEIAAGMNILYNDISGMYFALGYPLKSNKSAIGINYMNWNMGNIDVTTTSANVITSVAVNQGFFGVTYSVAFIDAMRFGITARYIYQDLGGQYGASVNGVAGDVGFLFLFSDLFRIGVSGQNLGVILGSSTDQLPRIIRAGIALCPVKNFTLAVDAEMPQDNDIKVHVGTEYVIKGEGLASLAIRLGYNQAEATTASGSSNLSGITIGLGMKAALSEIDEGNSNMDIDYVYAPYAGLGITHRFSVIFRL